MMAWLFSREFHKQELRIKEAVDCIRYAESQFKSILNRLDRPGVIERTAGEGVSLDVEVGWGALEEARGKLSTSGDENA